MIPQTNQRGHAHVGRACSGIIYGTLDTLHVSNELYSFVLCKKAHTASLSLYLISSPYNT